MDYYKGGIGMSIYNYLAMKANGDIVSMQEKMLYEHIQQTYPDYLIGNSIRWNFTKFLVDRNGKVIARFEPDDPWLI